MIACVDRTTLRVGHSMALGNHARPLIGKQFLPAEEMPFVSGLGDRLRRNVVEEKGAWEHVRAAAVTATAMPSGGGTVLVDNVATVFEKDMTPQQAADFLGSAATTQAALTGVGVAATKLAAAPEQIGNAAAEGFARGLTEGATELSTGRSATVVDPVTARTMANYDLTLGSRLYRWTTEGRVDMESMTVTGNPNSIAAVLDPYTSRAGVNASDVGPGLNVTGARGGAYQRPGGIEISIALEDVIRSGGKVYPDTSAVAQGLNPLYVTFVGRIPFWLEKTNCEKK